VSELAALERTYLAPGLPGAPIHREDSEWTPLVDGVEYLQAVDDEVSRTRSGDSLFVVGLQLDPDVDLRGRASDAPGHEPVGALLVAAAARGVDVRVIIAGSVFTGGMPFRFGPFPDNLRTATRLRGWPAPGADPGDPAPLAARVLLDWSGHRLGTNHQKAVVVTNADGLTAFVAGMDIARHRFDGPPHDTMRLGDHPWGWHDAGQRIRGPAARAVWETIRARWREATSLPARPAWVPGQGVVALNPARPATPPDPGPGPETRPIASPGRSLQVMRSYGPWKRHPPSPFGRRRWAYLPERGVREIFATLAAAIDGARRFVYVEDQYFREYPGGDRRYELYGHLRDAAARGVRVLLVGSGVRRPDDVGDGPANTRLPGDIARKVVAPLDDRGRANVALYRIEGVTVHSKIVLVDDRFACLGSANLFSRSMAGTDHELSVAVVDTGEAVRDLRVRLWSDHLRLDPRHPDVARDLGDLDVALGAWRSSWAGAHPRDAAWNAPDGDARRSGVSGAVLVGPPPAAAGP